MHERFVLDELVDVRFSEGGAVTQSDTRRRGGRLGREVRIDDYLELVFAKEGIRATLDLGAHRLGGDAHELLFVTAHGPQRRGDVEQLTRRFEVREARPRQHVVGVAVKLAREIQKVRGASGIQ